jgi:hypothetical protein
VYSNQQERNDGETHPRKKRKINHVDNQVGPSNKGDDDDNKSHDAKKPSGYTFLPPDSSQTTCNLLMRIQIQLMMTGVQTQQHQIISVIILAYRVTSGQLWHYVFLRSIFSEISFEAISR